MSRTETEASECDAKREQHDHKPRRQAYERACCDFLDAIDRAAQKMVIPDDPEDYDDAVIVSFYP
ncbi:hypothetical protein BOSEA31B_20140 [Hyphomicrobiales bacterium]|jgi:hypothetical protein|nr:hypothetical protein BOSEA31B_20140 [Hyphomicrobiales bacterium]CAH1702488.1 hypothetical protein BOSEA1005_30360 [Hyphomicrobiales bacterium]CAI0346689.1 hypothetical protein BO1005MUT1_520201 [Hyphomicrobiales bacterium]